MQQRVEGGQLVEAELRDHELDAFARADDRDLGLESPLLEPARVRIGGRYLRLRGADRDHGLGSPYRLLQQNERHDRRQHEQSHGDDQEPAAPQFGEQLLNVGNRLLPCDLHGLGELPPTAITIPHVACSLAPPTCVRGRALSCVRRRRSN